MLGALAITTAVFAALAWLLLLLVRRYLGKRAVGLSGFRSLDFLFTQSPARPLSVTLHQNIFLLTAMILLSVVMGR